MDYKMQSSFRGENTDTIGTYLSRLEYRVRFYRFFFLVPLYLTLPFFLAALREIPFFNGWRSRYYCLRSESIFFRRSSFTTWPRLLVCLS